MRPRQQRQWAPAHTQDARRLARVKHIDNIQPKITLQPHNVAVRTVQHLRIVHHVSVLASVHLPLNDPM